MGMYTAKMTEVHDIAKKLKESNQLESFLHITPSPAPSPQAPTQAPQPQRAGRSDT
jgi:hypothetical protein